MTRILAIAALLLASMSTVSLAQNDHQDWKPLVKYAPEGADFTQLTHEEVHMLLLIAKSNEKESEIRRAVTGFFNRRG